MEAYDVIIQLVILIQPRQLYVCPFFNVFALLLNPTKFSSKTVLSVIAYPA